MDKALLARCDAPGQCSNYSHVHIANAWFTLTPASGLQGFSEWRGRPYRTYSGWEASRRCGNHVGRSNIKNFLTTIYHASCMFAHKKLYPITSTPILPVACGIPGVIIWNSLAPIFHSSNNHSLMGVSLVKYCMVCSCWDLTCCTCTAISQLDCLHLSHHAWNDILQSNYCTADMHAQRVQNIVLSISRLLLARWQRSSLLSVTCVCSLLNTAVCAHNKYNTKYTIIHAFQLQHASICAGVAWQTAELLNISHISGISIKHLLLQTDFPTAT